MFENHVTPSWSSYRMALGPTHCFTKTGQVDTGGRIVEDEVQEIKVRSEAA